MGISLEEAAADLGAKPFKVMSAITLPRLAPGLLSGWLLAFCLSLDDLVIASFVTGPGSTTLPILIFSRIRLGLRPDINALATIIIIFVHPSRNCSFHNVKAAKTRIDRPTNGSQRRCVKICAIHGMIFYLNQ